MEIILAPNAIQEAEVFKGRLSYCKLGVAMIAAGVSPYHLAADLGYRVLYDAKFLDIPSVVGKAVEVLAHRGPLEAPPTWGITVHAAGGSAMLGAAKKAAGAIKVFGVLELTSRPDDWETWLFVKKRLKICKPFVDGVVCAVSDVAYVKETAPDLITLCPGIRPRGCRKDDQGRTATYARAAKSGADYLIIGRPLTEAADPDEALSKIRASVQQP